MAKLKPKATINGFHVTNKGKFFRASDVPGSLSIAARRHLEELIDKLPLNQKAYVLRLLVRELHAEGLKAPVIISNPDNPEEIMGYLLTFAVRHQLNNLHATSESERTLSVDLSRRELVQIDEQELQSIVNELELERG